MSWRSIEMQVALPRTQDVGKLQEQMGKQHQHFQESLAANQLKQEELKRKQVNEFERIKLLKDKKEENNPDMQHEETEKVHSVEEKIKHPYLGKRIDFNG